MFLFFIATDLHLRQILQYKEKTKVKKNNQVRRFVYNITKLDDL